MKIGIFLVAGVLLSQTVARPALAVDSPAEKFDVFCAEWMHKLEVRERDNQRQIHWVPNGHGVEGQYVGYSSEHVCKVKPQADAKAPPVGIIIYTEYRYQKRGDDAALAESTAPQAIEVTEVTEIFRYGKKGQWEY
jgi:hypothetical protein